MPNIPQKLLTTKTFLQSLNLLLKNPEQHDFLLAVSGGVDSMVLLSLFQSCGFHCEVAHINYKLRGEDSDLDQKTVENFCIKNGIKFHLYEVSESDKKPENSIQNWARNLRYSFFRKIQSAQNLPFLVTAHHLNDQLETFLINLSKASGIKGLSGIPANENGILRPLLGFSKDEIYEFAKQNNIEFREDLSNKKSDYLRNKIRHEISPKILEINKDFLENFGKSISYINETRNFVEEKIAQVEKEIIHEKDHCFFINKALLFKESSYVQFEILRKFGFDNNEILKICDAETGKKFFSKDFEILIDREFVTIKRIESTPINLECEIALALNEVNEVIIPLKYFEELEKEHNFIWEIDRDKISFPLKLRKKKSGDEFFPKGMMGKKKISKFFRDEKIPIFAQQKIWLLCDGKDKILGVIPLRQDRKFAADTNSEHKISIKFNLK